MADRKSVLILDYGSQYTQLIARRIRECHVYCEIHPGTIPVAQIERSLPRAHHPERRPPERVRTRTPRRAIRSLFDLGVPVLGLCYGEQMMAQQLGGKVEPSNEREYGPAHASYGGRSGGHLRPLPAG